MPDSPRRPPSSSREGAGEAEGKGPRRPGGAVEPPSHLLEEAWRLTAEALRSELGGSIFGNMVAPLELEGTRGGMVRLSAPSLFVRDRVEDAYGARVRALLAELAPGHRGVEIVLRKRRPADGPLGPGAPAAAPRGFGDLPQCDPSGLLRASTFDSFLVDDSNELACSAARLAASGSLEGNPLFIHGDVGLGKTHLLHAVGNAALSRNPRLRARRLTADEFLQDFVRALPRRATVALKDELRGLDLLLIDDLQFLKDAQAVQKDFSLLIESLIDRGSRVVVTAKHDYGRIEGLDERLRSRLSAGMAAQVRPPGLELRRRILRARAAAGDAGGQVPPEALDLLAGHHQRDIRALIGGLDRLRAQARLLGRPVTLEAAKRQVRDDRSLEPRPLTVGEIIRAVADRHGVPHADLLSKKRTNAVVEPRHLAMYLIREMTGRAITEIGRDFRRDHSTVNSAIAKIGGRRATDPDFARSLERMMDELRPD